MICSYGIRVGASQKSGPSERNGKKMKKERKKEMKERKKERNK
jgi:hypothetical protein